MKKTTYALIMASALVLAACGGGSDSEAGSDAAEPAVSTTAPSIDTETTVAPEETGEVSGIDRDATLKVSYSVGPTSFDPSISSSSFDSPALFLTYDRIVHLDPTANVVPGLAESWVFAEDGSSLTMTLREGMTFHDGNPVDAAAIVANLDRNKAGSAAGDLAAMESVVADDDLTFTITFSGPAGSWPAILADRAGAIASPAAFGDGLDLQPAGAGMYRVAEYVKDSKIVYERFEDYWDPEAAAAARLEFIIIPDNVAAFNALQGGEVDWGLILPTQIEDAEAAGLEVLQGLTLNIHHLQFNRTREYLDDVNVRRAISMAVNRDGYVEGILLGLGGSSSQPFPSGYWGSNPDAEIPMYDPEAARALLQEAGVPEGHTFDMVVPNTNVYPLIAEAVREDLLAVGLNAEIRLVDSVQTAPIFYGEASGDILMSVFGGRFDPAQHFGLLYTEGTLPNPGGATWPALDAVLPDVFTPGTQDDRVASVHEASKIISDDAVNVILHHPFGIFAYRPEVMGSEMWLIGRPEFRGLGLAAAE